MPGARSNRSATTVVLLVLALRVAFADAQVTKELQGKKLFVLPLRPFGDLFSTLRASSLSKDALNLRHF